MWTPENNPGISQAELARLLKLLSEGKENLWYNTEPWKSRRADVLRMDHHDCVICKSKGKAHRANIVHHVKHLKDRPDLALSIWNPDTRERQLISVCKACHEQLHPEAQRKLPQTPPVTVERWD